MVEKHKSEIQERFGKRVREIRKSKRLSQEALALSCELDRTYIGGVERGERNISFVNIYRIAEAPRSTTEGAILMPEAYKA